MQIFLIVIVLLYFRWVVYDLEYQEADGRKVSKLCYIMYSPDDNADNTEKFVVACNKDQVKSKVSEVNRDFQINRWDDLIEAEFIKAFNNWAVKSMLSMDYHSICIWRPLSAQSYAMVNSCGASNYSEI